MTIGLYTILSLYRYDRNQRFTEEEKQLQSRLIYHLVSAASHAFFLHLQLEHAAQETGVAAICDSKGGFYEAQPQFLQLLAEYYPDRQGMGLPFELPAADQSLTLNGLVVDCRALGELFVVSLRMNGPLDRLTNRESQIVQLVCKGLSFKEAAKTLDLAPSTVSNHLYRIYEKLGISSRVELAKLLERTGNIL